MTVDIIIEQARELSDDERKQLIHALVDMMPQKNTPPKKRKLRDYRGVGAHVYDGADAQEYVNKLRDGF